MQLLARHYRLHQFLQGLQLGRGRERAGNMLALVVKQRGRGEAGVVFSGYQRGLQIRISTGDVGERSPRDRVGGQVAQVVDLILNVCRQNLTDDVGRSVVGFALALEHFAHTHGQHRPAQAQHHQHGQPKTGALNLAG